MKIWNITIYPLIRIPSSESTEESTKDLITNFPFPNKLNFSKTSNKSCIPCIIKLLQQLHCAPLFHSHPLTNSLIWSLSLIERKKDREKIKERNRKKDRKRNREIEKTIDFVRRYWYYNRITVHCCSWQSHHITLLWLDQDNSA